MKTVQLPNGGGFSVLPDDAVVSIPVDIPVIHVDLSIAKVVRHADQFETPSNGYHMTEIPRGVFGEPSKIAEEFHEFEDAIAQDNPVMAIQELSDLIGAIQGYVAKYNLTLNDLIKMTDATKRAFESGHRKSDPA